MHVKRLIKEEHTSWHVRLPIADNDVPVNHSVNLIDETCEAKYV